jgi:hypothetical protein
MTYKVWVCIYQDRLIGVEHGNSLLTSILSLLPQLEVASCFGWVTYILPVQPMARSWWRQYWGILYGQFEGLILGGLLTELSSLFRFQLPPRPLVMPSTGTISLLVALYTGTHRITNIRQSLVDWQSSAGLGGFSIQS